MQLDIFSDSRDVMLRNEVLHALERHDAAAAGSAWQALHDEFPHDDALAALAVLIGALDAHGSAAFESHDALREARQRLRAEVVPAAQRLFGADAAAWLAPLWRDAARRAARLPFRAACSDDHAALLWLLGGDWPAAAGAVAGIESWRRIPAPLGWMAEARHRIDGLDAVWPLLAELAWLAPARFGELAARLADASLDKLLRRFDASFEGDGGSADLAWWPAWALTEKAGLARLMGAAEPCRDEAPEQAARLLVMLLGLERQGRHHELIERRKSLRDLHPGLWRAYMKTR